MRRSVYNEPKQVLMFNASGRLIAIVRSLQSAAELAGSSPMCVSYCCTGKSIASNGYYFRYIHPEVEVSANEDLGVLKIGEYDSLCGEKREYHTKGYMNNMRQKAAGIKKVLKTNNIDNQ
ncbi:hypothetical protein IR083_07600 [Dysgonomonas sp. GY75]|uniref:hypothetical protein n=1 Tax=Dysgonomonas sp. GY75 TaxID=2780419 RepID=UPI001883C28F|nr:hypothetical protein [Dysgonomonas sp. GY75]MBF0648681.1 hypothetical protein [Dysgonomonas sp. GY75]